MVRHEILFLEVHEVLDPDAVRRAPDPEPLVPDDGAEHVRDPDAPRRAAQRRRDLGQPEVEPGSYVAGDGVRSRERGDARGKQLVGRHGREARSRLRANLGDPDHRDRDHHEHEDNRDDRTGEAAETRHAFSCSTVRRERPDAYNEVEDVVRGTLEV